MKNISFFKRTLDDWHNSYAVQDSLVLLVNCELFRLSPAKDTFFRVYISGMDDFAYYKDYQYYGQAFEALAIIRDMPTVSIAAVKQMGFTVF